MEVKKFFQKIINVHYLELGTEKYRKKVFYCQESEKRLFQA